ncbi:MAG TPA: radical SAM protein [Vicinamibacteria bacterium]|nr:radical SAM protein [Vicinamibacteria bacterium]
MTGKKVVLTAPLTEMADSAGYFIQMGAASMPIWMEWVLNRKYPAWKEVERYEDGSAKVAPAGLRILEKVLARDLGEDDVVICYPQDLDRFIGPETRAVAISTHNPLGVTFAAGVYTSMFGSSKQPINSVYAREVFDRLAKSPHRATFKVLLGGSGAWQIRETGTADELGIDCVIDGRSEGAAPLFRKVLNGEPLPATVDLDHPLGAADIVFPDKPTTFGVVEMTTGCGRRCRFCMPDLNPQIALPREGILAAVRANAEGGNKQVSLATEDMFIWGQVQSDVPFFFPNREALLELYSDVANQEGVEQVVLSHSTMAPAVVDPVLIEKLTELLIDKSPLRISSVSRHPDKKVLTPLIGLETGSPRMAKQIMPSKAVPFDVEDWPSVVIRGLEVLNRNHWFPMMTLIVGNPDETDEDVMATLDLVYEMERRDLFAFLVPSVFTPLEGTRMKNQRGVSRTRDLSPLQWQLMMKCWKFNLRPGVNTRWARWAFRMGGLSLWAMKLRRTNGPNFKWAMMNFSGVFPERWMQRWGKLHRPRPLKLKTRAELLRSLRPSYWKYLRADTGDVPDATATATQPLSRPPEARERPASSSTAAP